LLSLDCSFQPFSLAMPHLRRYLSHTPSLLALLLSCGATLSVALASPVGSRTVLVTGGAGYIGSHTCLELLSTPNYNVVVIDNLDNSSEESLKRVRELTNCDRDRLHFRQCDLRDKADLNKGKMSRMRASCLNRFYVVI
jgi:hypothetical protein